MAVYSNNNKYLLDRQIRNIISVRKLNLIIMISICTYLASTNRSRCVTNRCVAIHDIQKIKSESHKKAH